eukprot:gb/GECG01003982.1/.p1 GENE.gb/GECG01003982.1/~~gb/GECG01003982.1/.p1  ORF type:complete len:349 (+),score=14.75 gb/GECG01003982.1/:1-1047(+)
MSDQSTTMRRDPQANSTRDEGDIEQQPLLEHNQNGDYYRTPESSTKSGSKPPKRGSALLSALAYSACSISMVLVNKGIFSKFDYPYSFTVLAIQGLLAVIWLLASHYANILTLKPLSKEVFKQWLPVNLLFVAMLYTSFQSLKLLAVPLVTIFKNITNLIVLYGEWLFFKEKCDSQVVASLCVVVIGAVLAGWTDIHFTVTGYAWMLLNCLMTASYVLYLRAAVTLDVSTHDKAFYNNLLMIPVALLLAAATGEFPLAVTSEEWGNGSFVATVVFSGSVGFLLNLASIWCVACTSASTYSMIGALNKVPLSVVGVLVFSEPVTFRTAIFISMSLLGGVMYTRARTRKT